MEERQGGILKACGRTEKYTGKKFPTCDDGKGCTACIIKHGDYLESWWAKKKMSPDLQRFYDYLAMNKRLLQSGRFKGEDWPAGSQYDVLDGLERMIRTGSFLRHSLVVESTLIEVDKIERMPKKAPVRSTSRSRSSR